MSIHVTKETIIETGIDVLLRKGYNEAGLKEILDSAGVPKGSFYHFFPSKEAFGIAVLDAYSHRFEAVLKQHLENFNLTPLQRLRKFFTTIVKHFDEEQHCKGGCLVGNLALEMADGSEAFKSQIGAILNKWQKHIEICLAEAKQQGEISPDTNTKALAEFILNSWEGAVMRMKVTGSVKPLKNSIDHLLKLIARPNLSGEVE